MFLKVRVGKLAKSTSSYWDHDGYLRGEFTCLLTADKSRAKSAPMSFLSFFTGGKFSASLRSIFPLFILILFFIHLFPPMLNLKRNSSFS